MTTQQLTKKEMKRLEKMFSKPGFKNRFHSMARFILKTKKDFTFQVNLGGGSYTDGNLVVIGLPEPFFNKPLEQQIMALKALNGHEIEHVVSSDFVVFKQFQETVYQFFKKNYGLSNGRMLGAQLLNCTEDGRIEKRLVNRLKGMKKYIQFLNGSLWDISPVSGENMLREYTLNVCYMATSGVWMKDFQEVYGGTQMEEQLLKVKPLILKAINEPTAQGCADVTMEIIKQNADFIAELLTPNPNEEEDGQSGNGSGSGDPTDQLDRTDAEYSTRPAGEDEDVELTESSHFVPEEENADDDQKDDKKEDKKQNEKGQKQASDDKQEDQDDSQEDADGSGQAKDKAEEEDSEESDAKGSGASDDEDSDSDEQDGDSQDQSDSNSDQDNSQGDKSDQDSQSDNQNDQEDSEDQDGVSGNKDSEDDGSHPEETKSVEDLIREAVREAEEDLQEETEKAIRQSIRDNDKADKEQARKDKERQKTQLDKKEQAAIMGGRGGPSGLEVKYDLHERVTESIDADVKRKGFKFGKDVEQIFLNKKGFTKKNRRGGMLDTNQLWRMTAGDTDVFVQKGRPKDSSYAISVLVDNSGSMCENVHDPETKRYNPKAYYAKQACVTLEEGIKGKIPLQITQFDFAGYNSPIRHKQIRGFEDTDSKNYSWSRMDPNVTGYGNADGYSIKIAHRELMKRPEHQKVLFVLSDGEPSGYSSYQTAHNHVREAVEQARKDGVTVIAIRFGTPDFLRESADTYKHMYQHSYIACAPSEIQKELVKLLKKTIK